MFVKIAVDLQATATVHIDNSLVEIVFLLGHLTLKLETAETLLLLTLKLPCTILFFSISAFGSRLFFCFLLSDCLCLKPLMDLLTDHIEKGLLPPLVAFVDVIDGLIR